MVLAELTHDSQRDVEAPLILTRLPRGRVLDELAEAM